MPSNPRPSQRKPHQFNQVLAPAARYPCGRAQDRPKKRPHYTKLPETRQRRADKLLRMGHSKKYL